MIHESSIDLLIAAAESAKMQRDAGVKEPVFKSNTGQIISIDTIQIYNLVPHRTFPISAVEGKPVFVGDTVYGKGDQYAYTVTDAWKDNALWESFTMTKPKPKTVMVELLREDAEWLADTWNAKNFRDCTIRIAAASKAALEK